VALVVGFLVVIKRLGGERGVGVRLVDS